MEELEQMRLKLGLSRRQICKLLKVDPSAWTRWMKTPKGAPPHIHQALEWYMRLVEQNPEQNTPQILAQKFESTYKASEIQLSRLKREVETLRQESVEKREVFEQLGGKIQNSFENVLLKFRDQTLPLKMLEIDSLKYENKKLQGTISDLQERMDKLFTKLETAKKSKTSKKNTKVNKKAKKKRKTKKVKPKRKKHFTNKKPKKKIKKLKRI